MSWGKTTVWKWGRCATTTITKCWRRWKGWPGCRGRDKQPDATKMRICCCHFYKGNQRLPSGCSALTNIEMLMSGADMGLLSMLCQGFWCPNCWDFYASLLVLVNYNCWISTTLWVEFSKLMGVSFAKQSPPPTINQGNLPWGRSESTTAVWMRMGCCPLAQPDGKVKNF